MTIACPPPEMLSALIGGGLAPDRASDLREHLEGCPSCLIVLDRLTDDPELTSWLAEGSGGREVASGGPLFARPETIGPYAIEAEVGRGGMGVVYRARDRSMDRVVALKVLMAEGVDPRSRDRFLREVRAAARVEDDHVVRVYSTSGPDDPFPYFAMEYLAGPTLADEVRETKRIDPRRAAEIVKQVALGLDAAHAAGLVHRDVKPSNVLFDPSGRAKIGDFGLALLEGEASGLTRDGVIAGTPAYLSPEQARGEPADARSDVYALGVTLYECLAGECPFRGSPHRVVHQVVNDEPRPPRVFHESIPRDLETIVLKAMAKEPDRRYRSARAMADDLGRWLRGEPIAARPAGPVERAWRSARRRPLVSALVAALVAVGVAGFSGIAWQWRRAEASAREATGFLAKALDSIDGYFVKVSENRLLDVPNLQPLRKELLQAARDYYEGLLRDRPGNPTIGVELARARTKLAGVVGLIGSRDEAIALFRQSLAEFDRIIARSPRDMAPRFGRLACLTSLAKVQLTGSKLNDARATYRLLLAEAEGLRRKWPDAVEPLQAIYAARHGLGSAAYFANAEPERMIADYEQALHIGRELIDHQPRNPTYRRNLSRTGWMLGMVYEARGRPGDARAARDESHRVTRSLVADHPESQEYRYALGTMERQFGVVALGESLKLKGPPAMAKLDEARPAFDRAVAIDRALVRENPRLDTYRLDLITALSWAASAEMSRGRTGEALALLGEAREVGASVANPGGEMAYLRPAMLDVLVQTACALADGGRSVEALERLDEAEQLFGSLTPAERSVRSAVDLRDLMIAFTRAVILWDADRLADAVKTWDRAEALAPPRLRPLTSAFRAMHRAESAAGPAPDPKLLLAASPLADLDRASPPLPGFNLVNYARIYALAAPAAADPAARESLNARAVFCLEKAGDARYFRHPLRRRRLDAEPAFTSLRTRRDYREFRRTVDAGDLEPSR